MKNPALGKYELQAAAKFADELNNLSYTPVSPVELSIDSIEPRVLLTFDYDEDEGFVLTDFSVDDVTHPVTDES